MPINIRFGDHQVTNDQYNLILKKLYFDEEGTPKTDRDGRLTGKVVSYRGFNEVSYFMSDIFKQKIYHDDEEINSFGRLVQKQQEVVEEFNYLRDEITDAINTLT